MKETELNKVLNYMKQYVENKYEHDSEPMLNWKDLQLVLNEIERLDKDNGDIIKLFAKERDETIRLNNIINEFEKWLEEYISLLEEPDIYEEQTREDLKEVLDKLKELKGE